VSIHCFEVLQSNIQPRISNPSFACANFISTACTLGNTGFVPTPKTTIGEFHSFLLPNKDIDGHFSLGIYAAVLFSQGLTNTFGVHLLHYLNNISVWWHAVGTTSLIIAILAKAPSHQSAEFVFKTFIDGTGPPGQGWGDRASHVYVVVIGVRINSMFIFVLLTSANIFLQILMAQVSIRCSSRS
jgi:hypothetical protein